MEQAARQKIFIDELNANRCQSQGMQKRPKPLAGEAEKMPDANTSSLSNQEGVHTDHVLEPGPVDAEAQPDQEKEEVAADLWVKRVAADYSFAPPKQAPGKRELNFFDRSPGLSGAHPKAQSSLPKDTSSAGQ